MQPAAVDSFTWYEEFAARMDMDADEPADDDMTRRSRMSHQRLRAIAPGFTAAWEARTKQK